MEFFDDLLIKKNIINFNVIAGGIGAKGDNGYERDIDPAYASSDENAHPIYVYRIERHVDLDVSLSVHTGNKIPAAFSAYQSDFMKMKQKYPELKEMDFYSAILAKAEVEKWLQVLEECANTWIKSAADRKIILKKLKKLKAKSIQIETVGESIKI
jgi:transketolase